MPRVRDGLAHVVGHLASTLGVPRESAVQPLWRSGGAIGKIETAASATISATYVTYVTFVKIHELDESGTTSRESGITATPSISIIASGCQRAVVPMPAMAG
jgi:hypothetical protein